MVKIEEFNSHALWNVLDALQERLQGDLHLADDEDRYNAQRIHAAVEFVDSLREIDPLLLEPQGMNEIHSNLQQVDNALSSYLSDPPNQRQYLVSAAGSVANVTANARAYLVPFVPDEAQRAAKAASTRYKNALDAEVERLKAEVDSVGEQLVEERAQREADAAAIAEKRRADEAAATERLEELSATIAQREATIDDLTTKLNAQIDSQRTAFEEEAASRAEAYKQAQTDRETAEDERIEEANTKAEEAMSKQMAAADVLLAKLETYKSQAAALVDTTSRHAIAGDYGTWASNQASAAFRWTLATVAIGIATVAGLIYAVGSAADDSIQFTVYKTSISVIGLIVAGYCARQAAEHRREERTAKRLALDLAALEPFLEQIEDPKDLREEIARRVFVPERQSPDGDGSVRAKRGSLSITELTELLTAIRGNQGP